jgi:hypothetical protein
MLFSDAFSKSPDDFKYISEPVIPQSILGYGTNTQHLNFPPKMADGRSLMSSWQPESTMNNEIIKSNQITSNWEYRKYLTNNGYNIMSSNFKEACNDTGYTYQSELNSSTPTERKLFNSVNDTNQSFGYHDSDLKQLYLSREQLDSRKVSPVITQAELMSLVR